MRLPSEVRRDLMEQHRRLEARLGRLEQLVRQLGERSITAGEVREEVAALRAELEAHNRYEDRELRPVLEGADAWGAERAERLDAHHRGLHEALERGLTAALAPEHAAEEMTRAVILAVTEIRTHMASEEHEAMHPGVLRDDVVSLDASGG